MKPKIVIGTGLIALLSAGAAAFGVGAIGTSEPAPAEETEAAEAPADPAVTLPSVSPEAQVEAERLVDISQVISEITQEALERPREERMTPEEARELILGRMGELEVRP
ncbi:MAG: hypothetical protein WD602_01235 [Actinomycetota bacterium]